MMSLEKRMTLILKDVLTIWSEGEGVGINLSFLRPRGVAIKGKGGSSSGPINFLDAVDRVASTIESGRQKDLWVNVGMFANRK